jgi:hypothetical protein
MSHSSIIIFDFTYFLKFLVAPVFRLPTQGFALFNLKVFWINNHAGVAFYELVPARTKLKIIQKEEQYRVCFINNYIF